MKHSEYDFVTTPPWRLIKWVIGETRDRRPVRSMRARSTRKCREVLVRLLRLFQASIELSTHERAIRDHLIACCANSTAAPKAVTIMIGCRVLGGYPRVFGKPTMESCVFWIERSLNRGRACRDVRRGVIILSRGRVGRYCREAERRRLLGYLRRGRGVDTRRSSTCA